MMQQYVVSGMTRAMYVALVMGMGGVAGCGDDVDPAGTPDAGGDASPDSGAGGSSGGAPDSSSDHASAEAGVEEASTEEAGDARPQVDALPQQDSGVSGFGLFT